LELPKSSSYPLMQIIASIFLISVDIFPDDASPACALSPTAFGWKEESILYLLSAILCLCIRLQ
jgi:hypothetical protein